MPAPTMATSSFRHASRHSTPPAGRGFKGGVSTAQRGSAIGQRGWKRQPGGMLAGSGRHVAQPDIGHAEARLGRQHGGEQRLGVGMLGRANSVSVGARSTMRPRYITATSLATCSTTARLWLMKR